MSQCVATGDEFLLSICIPTHNRATFIAETLQSIHAQNRNDVQIIIVDGASTDNTEAVVRGFEAILPTLLYHRCNTNGGVDKDLNLAVEIAKGKFVWLMSSDDLLPRGALDIVMDRLRCDCDIYLGDITLCDRGMRPIRNTRFLKAGQERFLLSQRADLLRYLGSATSNNALFCYISAIVVRRESWLSVASRSAFFGSCYAHVFTIFCSARVRGQLQYIDCPIVLNRGHNDSFSSHGLQRRFRLDFDGYLSIANALFAADTEVRNAFLTVMRREHPWYHLVKLRSDFHSAGDWAQFCERLSCFGYTRRLLRVCGFIGRFRHMTKVLVYLNRRFPRFAAFRLLRGF
jgi:O-antigen biosynthesis alpha-1,3-abequosyltransferase